MSMNDNFGPFCTYTIPPPSSKSMSFYYSGPFQLNMTFGLVILFTIYIITAYIMKCINTADQKNPLQQRMEVEAAIREFERKAVHQPLLGHLAGDATFLLKTFKSNIHSIHAYKLYSDPFSFNQIFNNISKIKLYDGNTIAVTIHIFPADFKETAGPHNHSKTQLLQNICGEYIHTTWRINTASSSKLYKFSYDPNQAKGGEEINGSLEYTVMDNYKAGNWKCLHPATLHTVTAAPNTQRIISFAIKSKLNPNQDRFILSKEQTSYIPTYTKSVEVTGEERENILKYIIDSSQ